MAPPHVRISGTDVDHKSIVALSQTCSEELDAKTREQRALTKLLQELKRKKMVNEARLEKKKREVDGASVQTLELDKKVSMVNESNRIMIAELTGLRKENERLEVDVETLRRDLQAALSTYEAECVEVEKVKKMLYAYRKEIGAEEKHHGTLQQDLRASKTAQALMNDRLGDMDKRNRALRTCVTDTFNN